ncbi:hypothetical protein BAE44_0000251 [Dichanthelium oligosanthes]|uniref:Hydrophobic seed protein domain-containing protein n=1 Tax=Dichanthelium oligosanthes TaxID=888268 RepID=A0A1E5WNJ3_9POAL|nr:hypothetical protein BAE44_0000251 [Dichanthelium oligosanthes]
MASKPMASPMLLLLAMALMLEACAHAHFVHSAQAPTLAPAPSQSLCPNGFSSLQEFETAARARLDIIEFIFVPRLMVILDSLLAELGLLHPGVEICVCTNNPHYLISGTEPKIKCIGGSLVV